MFGLYVDEDASEQQGQNIINLLLGEHALRVCLVLQRDSTEIISSPVHSSDVDNIADDINPGARESVDRVRILLDEIESLLLVPSGVICDRALVREERVKSESTVGIVPVKNVSIRCR